MPVSLAGNPDLDLTVGAARGAMGQISQGVLIPGFTQRPGIGVLDRVTREAGKNLAARGIRIFGQNVAISEMRACERNMQLL